MIIEQLFVKEVSHLELILGRTSPKNHSFTRLPGNFYCFVYICFSHVCCFPVRLESITGEVVLNIFEFFKNTFWVFLPKKCLKKKSAFLESVCFIILHCLTLPTYCRCSYGVLYLLVILFNIKQFSEKKSYPGNSSLCLFVYVQRKKTYVEG